MKQAKKLMKISSFLIVAGICIATCSSHAQGTFVYDQQSSTTEVFAGGLRFQDSQPFGQSFVPSLSSIDFVRLYMFPGGPQSSDATVYVNLLSGSINGTPLASTLPITIPNFFAGFTNFYFSTSVPLALGTTYYLQPVASAGDPITDISSGFTYLNGDLFVSGVQQATAELWFREGIVVPEPATTAITMIGIIALVTRMRRRC